MESQILHQCTIRNTDKLTRPVREMDENLDLTILGEDVLNIIIDLLHSESPHSLRSLRRVSAYLKTLAERALYRCLELSDEHEALSYTRWMVHRLLDPSDQLIQHVREFKITNTKVNYRYVGNFKDDSEMSGLTDLERIIGKLANLQSFSWNINRDIPEPILSRLERQWPNVKLSVGNYSRAETNTRLFSSPLLHSLSFCILNTTATVGATHQLEQFSKLPELRKVLMNSPNLRSLDVKFKCNWIPREVKWSGITADPHILHLPLEASDRLPPLHELTFSGPLETYEFDLKHCRLLSQVMDWSHLRRLDLGLSCPQHFFEEIGGSLQSLRSLKLGIRTGGRRLSHWPQGPMICENLDPAVHFIKSLCGLHELDIMDLDNVPKIIAPTILESQKSLRRLSYRIPPFRNIHRRSYPDGWTTAHLEDLREQCPNLLHLEISFPLTWNGQWPHEQARVLSYFNHLRTIRVFVELIDVASDFAMDYIQNSRGSVPMVPLNLDLARTVTTALFESFYKIDPHAQLRFLEVCFEHKRREDRGQAFNVQSSIKISRLERDDAPSPLEGGYTIEAPGRWVDVTDARSWL